MKNQKLTKLSGAVLLLALTILYPYIGRIIAANLPWTRMVEIGYFLFMSLALCLLGVIKPIENPLNYLAPILMVVALYVPNLFQASVSQSYTQWYWLRVSPMGTLLFSLCVVLAVWSIVQKKKWRSFNLSIAVHLSAIVALALFHPYIYGEIRQAILAINMNLIRLPTIYAYIFGALLLPFLKKERQGGVILLTAGALMLAGHILMVYTQFRFAQLANQTAVRFQSVMQTFANPSHYSLVIALLLGGIWCTLPCRICHRRRDMIESDA